MTTIRYTSKGLTLDQRRTLNILNDAQRQSIIRRLHRESPIWYNSDGTACCRLNRTSCDDCPNCNY